MQIQTIQKSHGRPTYDTVRLDSQAKCHLFISEEASLELLEPLLKACEKHTKHSLVVADLDISAITTDTYQLIPRTKTAHYIGRFLAKYNNHSTVYIAGTESFIWDIQKLVTQAGYSQQNIRLLPPISNTRRVICTHCFTVMDNINHELIHCSGCQRSLEVQDQFSELHGAYAGVQVKKKDSKPPVVQDKGLF